MCWPGHHQHNCEERGRHRSRINQSYASSDKLQCAIYYAIDGDQVKFHFLKFLQGVYNYELKKISVRPGVVKLSKIIGMSRNALALKLGS